MGWATIRGVTADRGPERLHDVVDGPEATRRIASAITESQGAARDHPHRSPSRMAGSRSAVMDRAARRPRQMSVGTANVFEAGKRLGVSVSSTSRPPAVFGPPNPLTVF
jgi:hypothetical protein